MWCFWHGHFGWGLLAAWLMTFLDTVDGKLARVTLQSSPWGNVFDHSIDLIHPPFWWWAWVVGLSAVGLPLADPSLVLWVIIGGYVLQRVEEGIFGLCFKMDMHVWQRFDSLLRLVTARRNPNLAILTVAVLLGRPDTGHRDRGVVGGDLPGAACRQAACRPRWRAAADRCVHG